MKPNIPLLLLLASAANAARVSDLVGSLPDLPALPSRWFSGYYNVSLTRQLHYMFVESQSSPSKDPVVIWFAGGPGGSTMLDLFMGIMGPFQIDDMVTWKSDASINPYSINNSTNILYLDNPAGVGFSYVGKDRDYSQNNIQVAADAFSVLQ
jgi:carboxypeptidase C (cathepsin A)